MLLPPNALDTRKHNLLLEQPKTTFLKDSDIMKKPFQLANERASLGLGEVDLILGQLHESLEEGRTLLIIFSLPHPVPLLFFLTNLFFVFSF